jgi:hypothetical protein
VNPKRDLSNGYVFAEIFNRYFPDEIEMYTVDNGMKQSIKENNWEFLHRFFKKKNIPIDFKDYVSITKVTISPIGPSYPSSARRCLRTAQKGV